ncbi:MAG: ABC transporter ATP-binding protein [Desulfobacteraceae bacterium]|jgi:iron complex transport system ATP-binding protein
MLEVKNLQLGYGKLPPVIHDVNITLKPEEFMVLIGPNGSGKSTILKAMAASLRPRKGTVSLKNKPLQHYSSKALAKQLAFLPQSPIVPEDFTVRDLVGYGRTPHLNWNGRMTKRDWAIVDEAIARTRLTLFKDRSLSSLSGGERQRAWLALALAQKPDILLLDEPTTFLDICYQFEVLELVKQLNNTLGLSTVIVLHDLNQAARYAHTIVVVNNGRIVASGPPGDVITQDLLAEVFNIRVDIKFDKVHNCPYIIPMESLRK